jgi:hypothetical protein
MTQSITRAAKKFLVAAVLALVVASCGGSSLAVFRVGAAQHTADAKLAVGNYTPPTYVAGESLSSSPLVKQAQAWQAVSPKDVVAQFTSVVNAFGLKGTATEVQDSPGNYQISSGETDGPSAWMYTNGSLVSWSYSGSTPSGTVSSPGATPSSGSGSTSASTQSTVAPDSTEVTTPTNLMSPQEAEAKVRPWLSSMGLTESTATLTSNKDDYSTNVTVSAKVQDIVTDMNSYFTFGSNGDLMSANGSIYTLKKSGEYPLISPKDAVSRIASSIVEPMMARDTSSNSSASVAPSPSDASSTSVPQSPTVVTITAASLALTLTSMANGDTYLLPAYSLVGDNGATFTVPAIEDKYLDTGASVNTTQNTSGSSAGSPGTDVATTSISASDAQLLVGLTEQGAADTCAKNGWTMRVAVRDGKNYMLTTDYNPLRVNVSLAKGIVTSVTVG